MKKSTTMSTPGDTSESEWDAISNPDSDVLDASLTDLGTVPLALLTPAQSQNTSVVVHEPPVSTAAKDRFSTASLTANDIQSHVQQHLVKEHSVHSREASHKTVRGSNPNGGRAANLDIGVRAPRRIRVYIDGLFDGFNVAHAHQLRQAKLAFPDVYLIVGVLSPPNSNTSPIPPTSPISPLVPYFERCEILRHVRWVDEVLEEAPWTLDFDFVHRMKIDYISIDEGASCDPAVGKERLRGYDSLKKMGKIITTRRTTGATALIPTHAHSARPLQGAPCPPATAPHPSSAPADSNFVHAPYDDTPFGLPTTGSSTPLHSESSTQKAFEQMDIFGIGL